MVDTGAHVPAVHRDRFTTLYRRHEQGVLRVSDEPDGAFDEPPALASGAGGLVTTVDDQPAFARMLIAEGEGPIGRLLSEGSVRQMMSDQITPGHQEMGGVLPRRPGLGLRR